MIRKYHGRVHGRTIELDEDLGVAEGQEVVEVQVTVLPKLPRKTGEGLLRTEGALAEDDEWDAGSWTKSKRLGRRIIGPRPRSWRSDELPARHGHQQVIVNYRDFVRSFSRWPTSADGSMSRGHWSRRPGVRIDFLLEASPSTATGHGGRSAAALRRASGRRFPYPNREPFHLYQHQVEVRPAITDRSLRDVRRAFDAAVRPFLGV